MADQVPVLLPARCSRLAVLALVTAQSAQSWWGQCPNTVARYSGVAVASWNRTHFIALRNSVCRVLCVITSSSPYLMRKLPRSKFPHTRRNGSSQLQASAFNLSKNLSVTILAHSASRTLSLVSLLTFLRSLGATPSLLKESGSVRISSRSGLVQVKFVNDIS